VAGHSNTNQITKSNQVFGTFNHATKEKKLAALASFGLVQLLHQTIYVTNQKKTATEPIQNIAAACSISVVVPAIFKFHQFNSYSKMLIAPNRLKIKAATEQALSKWTATCQRKPEMLAANA